MAEESQRVVETRRRVMRRVVAARSGLAALSARVTEAMSDPRLSIQGRQEAVERIIAEGRALVEGEIASARGDIEFVIGQARAQLTELTEVTQEILATRAAVLSPVLNVAMENPGALLNAYRRRFADRTDRRLLGESAQVVVDGIAGSDGGIRA